MSKVDELIPACPICEGKAQVHFNVNDIPIFQCDDCRHRFHPPGVSAEQHVTATYGDDYFQGGGAGYENYSAEEDLLRNSGRFYASKLSRFAEPERMLDVGAAAGYILQGFQELGWQGTGIEPNQTMAQDGQQRGLDVRAGSLESYSSTDQYELISMIQVIAHIVDIRQALDKVHRLLAPEGLLLIETWDRNSLTARLFGKSWHEYSPPSVVHWFTRTSLDEFVTECGFTKLATGRPSKWIQLGHAASLIRYKCEGSTWKRVLSSPLVLMPKRLKVPYFLDDVFWSLYQRSD